MPVTRILDVVKPHVNTGNHNGSASETMDRYRSAREQKSGRGPDVTNSYAKSS